MNLKYSLYNYSTYNDDNDESFDLPDVDLDELKFMLVGTNFEKLRLLLSDAESSVFEYENLRLLIHPSIHNKNLINNVRDNFESMPVIEPTYDNCDISFNMYNYDNKLYSKSELLSFLYASITRNWNIVKGIDILTKKSHFWLKHNNIIFDISLNIITNDSIYSKRYKKIEIIKKENIDNYLINHNNLYKFYNKSDETSDKSFSINYINKFVSNFKANIFKQIELDNDNIENIKEYADINDYINIKQILTKKRRHYLKNNGISIHPSVDKTILEDINEKIANINKLVKTVNNNIDLNYYNNDIFCYRDYLVVFFNLYDNTFKAIKGMLSTKDKDYNCCWLEKDNLVYDPSLRIITKKELYYTFFDKVKEYNDEEKQIIVENYLVSAISDNDKKEQISNITKILKINNSN